MIIVSKQLNFVHRKEKNTKKQMKLGTFFALSFFFNSNTLTAHRKQVDKGVSHCKNTLFSSYKRPDVQFPYQDF